MIEFNNLYHILPLITFFSYVIVVPSPPSKQASSPHHKHLLLLFSFLFLTLFLELPTVHVRAAALRLAGVFP